jgi:BASS family bile acid:Na+ symporter
MDDALRVLEKLSVLVFLIGSMLGMGLTLTPGAIFAPLRDLKLILLALALNFVIAPGFAWLLTVLIPMNHGHAIGLILLGGAAGAPFLPKLAETARGDLPFTIALMALLTVGTIIFMPVALPGMIPGVQVDPWAIARPLVLFLVLPMALGMLIKAVSGSIASSVAPFCAKAGSAGLLVLFVLLIIRNEPALLAIVGSGAIAATTLYVLGLFAAGWLLSAGYRRVRGVIALGTAARNFAAAFVPAANSFRDPHVTSMLIVSAIVGLVVTFLAAAWIRRATAAIPT